MPGTSSGALRTMSSSASAASRKSASEMKRANAEVLFNAPSLSVPFRRCCIAGRERTQRAGGSGFGLARRCDPKSCGAASVNDSYGCESDDGGRPMMLGAWLVSDAKSTMSKRTGTKRVRNSSRQTAKSFFARARRAPAVHRFRSSARPTPHHISQVHVDVSQCRIQLDSDTCMYVKRDPSFACWCVVSECLRLHVSAYRGSFVARFGCERR